MNQAEYLCHSSGPWKKHKYFQKIGEGANAVYRYAKDNVGGRITGDYYDKKAEEYENEAERLEQYRYMLQDAGIKSASNHHNIKNERLAKANDQYLEDVKRQHGEYNDKQIEAESTARKFRKKAENSIGEKITGKRSEAKMNAAEKRLKETDKMTDYWEYNREKKKHDRTLAGVASNIKKRLKHDDFSESVANGEIIINNLFNKR